MTDEDEEFIILIPVDVLSLAILTAAKFLSEIEHITLDHFDELPDEIQEELREFWLVTERSAKDKNKRLQAGQN